LITGWPLLRRWLDETQEDAGFLEQLRNASKQWQARGHAKDLLWRGEAMQEAKHWHSRYRGELPELQRAYLNAVFTLSIKATRRKRLAIIASLAFLSLLLIAAGVALVTIRNAQQEATAQARRVAEQLALTQAAEKTAKAAEATAKAAETTANTEREKAIAASKNLETKNTALVAAIDAAERARQEAERARLEAEDARQRAEASKRDEQQSKKRATEAAKVATEAAAEAKRAGEQLETLLTQERKRVQELEAQTRGAKIVRDVTLQ
jgi:chromosome segregation ATPase